MLDIFRRGKVLPGGRTTEEEVRLVAMGKPEPAPQPKPSSGSCKLGTVLSALFAGRGAFPCLEGTKEGVGMLVTEEVCNRVEINGTVPEVVTCQFAAVILHHSLKRDPRIRQPPL